MQDHLQAIVTVLTLINPLMCAAIFLRIEAGQSRGRQFADAGKAALAVLVILVLAALCGERLLSLFGVSLDAFMVAGGSVLAWIGFGMLRGPGRLPGSQRRGGKRGSVAHATDSLCRQPRHDHRGHYTCRCPNATEVSRHRPGSRIRGRVGDVARDRPGRTFRRAVSRREQLCARHRHPFHGVDRDRDGSPVHAHGHSDVHENQRAVIAIVFSRPVSIGNHEPSLNETEGLTMGKLKTSSKKSETQPSTETSPSFGFHPSWAELYEMGDSLHNKCPRASHATPEPQKSKCRRQPSPLMLPLVPFT